MQNSLDNLKYNYKFKIYLIICDENKYIVKLYIYKSHYKNKENLQLNLKNYKYKKIYNYIFNLIYRYIINIPLQISNIIFLNKKLIFIQAF